MRKTALDMVHELARSDGRVVFIGSDLGAGTLDAMRAEMPDRFFMEGVAEQNIVGMAAGICAVRRPPVSAMPPRWRSRPVALTCDPGCIV